MRLSISYSGFIPSIIKAIQEQDIIIKNQQSKISNLKLLFIDQNRVIENMQKEIINKNKLKPEPAISELKKMIQDLYSQVELLKKEK